MTKSVHVFSQAGIDRAAHHRRDESWLAAARAHAAARCLAVREGDVLVTGPQDAPRLAIVPAMGAELFLGLVDTAPLFARLYKESDAFPTDTRFLDLREVGLLLPAHEASEAAYALALAGWHGRHPFCALCGQPSVIAEAGHKRVCPACAAEHFPRTDPAVIVLVTHEDKCLLARNARYRENMRSVLAGFVEPGENLEEAVAREVFEEAGVRVTAIAYQASQPWPFPSSLMLGFRARADSAALNVDGVEILEAAWYSRVELTIGLENGTLSLPGPLSIARRLIEEWRAED
jgi:NAD+ diphosphatase